MRIALLQCNLTVADVRGNCAKLAAAVTIAAAQGADCCVASELAVSGYPARDLLLDFGFISAVRTGLDALAADISGLPPLLLGFPEINDGLIGNPLYNSVALLQDGAVKQVFRKSLLPTYDVFDERRYFEPGRQTALCQIGGRRLGVTVCEDVWNDKDFWRTHRYYAEDPVEALVAAGADAIVNLSASPFTLGKQRIRETMLAGLARKHHLPVLYVNQVGGNDDLVFDGRSLAFAADGRCLGRAKAFEEDILLVDLDNLISSIATDNEARESEAWRALVLGTHDYVRKCGFTRALLGLSGGIDSSLTAAIAVEALGAANVTGVLMPSPFSSPGSIHDALALARNLGIRTLEYPISSMMQAFDDALAPAFAGRARDVTEENVQARIRGVLLMALSNKFGDMLLTTGNKSELAVGYCTIYGDMAGGLGVIADLPKTLVYAVARWLNRERGEVIPAAAIDKAPSAELRPNQLDQDSLPPYEVLDAILELRLERHATRREILAQGFDAATVDNILKLIHFSEFKRKQAPPGVKITDRAFGTGWRMPLARAAGWELTGQVDS